jgi:HK97 family phage major capsid protein
VLTLEEVTKQIKDATDAIQKAHGDSEARVKELVEKTLRDVLRAHPGVTPERKVQFEGIMPDTEIEMFGQLPKEVQAEADKMYILANVLHRPVKSLKRYANFRKMFSGIGGEFAKALDSTTAGGVDEWVPTQMSPNLIEKIRLQLKVAALFPTITMPSNPYELPIEVGNINSFLQPENTGDTGQTIIPVGDDASISGKTTFTAKGHATRVLVSKEATEDSVVAILPFLQNRIVLALAQGREDFTLNGDTNGTHEDTDITAAQARRKIALGLRAMTNDNTATHQLDLSTLSLNTLLDLRALMGVYGANPADLAWIVSFKAATALMKVDVLQTLDKIGPRAVVLAGQIGEILGSPVILSEYVRQDLNASAIYEASATKTVIHCVHRNGLAYGDRSNVTTQLLTELYAVYNQNALLATERVDFQPLFPIASNVVVATGINVG